MVRFSWDPEKARTNLRKHGISFEMAREVFNDPWNLTEQDRVKHGEVRWQTIGLVGNVLLVLVAHTYEYKDESEDEEIRIISARRANRQEQARYNAQWI